ncbi:hypothetical protein ACHWQZ_G002365 [Mnemiopsis leidyi]
MSRFIIAETLNRSIDYPVVEEVLSVGYYSVIMVLAIFGNIFIIYATLKVRARSHDAMTILLIRVLAVNDLLGGVILYPNFIILLSKGYFPFSATYCIVLGIFEIYCPLCSTLLVMTLVLTKVAMIRNPFLSMGNARKIFLVLPPLYILGAIAPTGVFFDLGHYMFSPERGTCTYQFYPPGMKEKIFVMTCTTLFVIIPLCVILCMSIYILRFMRQMRRKTKSMQEKCNSQAKRTNDKILKSVVIVLLVVVAYVVCWSMFFCVTTVAFLIGGEDGLPRQILLWQKALLMTNNAVNPMVYVCGNKKLQLVLKNLIYKIRGIQPVNQDFNFSTIVHDTKPTFQQIGRSLTAFRSRPSPEIGSAARRVVSEVIAEKSPVGSPTLGAIRCVTMPVVGRETKRSRRKILRLAIPGDLTEEMNKENVDSTEVIFVGNGLTGHIGKDNECLQENDLVHEEPSIVPNQNFQDEVYTDCHDENVLVESEVSPTETCPPVLENNENSFDRVNGVEISCLTSDKVISNHGPDFKVGEATEKINGSIPSEVL